MNIWWHNSHSVTLLQTKLLMKAASAYKTPNVEKHATIDIELVVPPHIVRLSSYPNYDTIVQGSAYRNDCAPNTYGYTDSMSQHATNNCCSLLTGHHQQRGLPQECDHVIGACIWESNVESETVDTLPGRYDLNFFWR